MDQAERDRTAYTEARKFLLRFEYQGVTERILDKYLHFSEIQPKPETLAGIYLALLQSAQNRNMVEGLVGGASGGVSRLGTALFDFEPVKVIQKYSADWEQVLDEIERVLKPKGKIRKSKKSIWPRYCQTILSSAEFLSQFDSAQDFYSWVDTFDQDPRSRAALPMLLAREIDGYGFTLSCDFLKELGYANFAKPDVHVKEFFRKLGLCPLKADDYGGFRAEIRVAHSC